MATNVSLHFLDAGSGEAMVLDYESPPGARQLVLIDGGSIRKDIQLHHSPVVNNGTAPYYKYLISALRSIWGDGEIKVAAIIISHLEEDHYGGLLRCLDSIQNHRGTIDFGKRVFTPYQPGTGFELIQEAMRSHQLYPKQISLQGDQAENGVIELLPKVGIDFPTKDGQVVEFQSSQDDVLDPEKALSPAKLSEKCSMLLSTVPADSFERSVYLTGDNTTSNIDPYVRGKHFSIYKIQNHGFFEYDSEKRRLYESWKKTVGWEVYFYALLRPMRMIDELPLHVHLRERETDLLRKILRGKGINPYRLQKTLGWLHDQYKEALWKGEIPNINTPIDVRQAIDELSGLQQLILSPFRFLSTAERDSWLYDVIWEEFDTALEIGAVSCFYRQFVADVYAVSGTWDPSATQHPSPQVLVGLALAMIQERRQATLYLTDGNSLQPHRLGNIGQAKGDYTVDQLFFGENLKVRFLTRNSYMTLRNDTNALEKPFEFHVDSKPYRLLPPFWGIDRILPYEYSDQSDHEKFAYGLVRLLGNAKAIQTIFQIIPYELVSTLIGHSVSLEHGVSLKSTLPFQRIITDEELSDELEVAGLRIEHKYVSITAEAPGTDDQQYSLEAESAKLIMKEMPQLGGIDLDLSLKCSLDGSGSDLTYTFTKVQDIRAVAYSLKLAYENLRGLEIPMPLALSRHGQYTVDTLGDRSRQVSFCISQPVKGMQSHILSSINILANFTDNEWTTYFPSSMKFKGFKDLEVYVSILNPREDTPAVKVELTLSLPIPKVKYGLDLWLLVEPLENKNEHDRRVYISCQRGVSLPDITDLVGLDIQTSLLQEIPIFQDLVEIIRVERASAAIEEVDSVPVFKERSATIAIDQLPPINDKISLKDVKITIEEVVDDIVYNFGHGVMSIPGIDETLYVDFKLPQLHIPGSLTIRMPDRRYLHSLFMYLSIDPISAHVSWSKTIPSVELSLAHTADPIYSPNEPPRGKPTIVVSDQTTVSRPSLKFAGIKFYDVVFYTITDLVDAATKPFTAHVKLPSGILNVDGRRNAEEHKLSATLKSTGSATLSELVDLVLPETLKGGGLLPVIGHLNLDTVKIGINTKANKAHSLEVHLKRGEKMNLQSDKAQVKITDLVVTYGKGKKNDSDTENGDDLAKSEIVENGVSLEAETEEPKEDGIVENGDSLEETSAEREELKKDGNDDGNDGNAKTNDNEAIEDDQEHNELVVVGTILLKTMKARITFTYRPGDSITVDIGDKSLTLGNFIKLFKVPKPVYEAPASSPNFFDLQISEASGTVEIGEQEDPDPPESGGDDESKTDGEEAAEDDTVKEGENRPSTKEENEKETNENNENVKDGDKEKDMKKKKKKARLADLKITVISPHIFNILDTPSIVLDQLLLKVKYDSKGAQGHLSGVMAISKFQLEAYYVKASKLGSVFLGRLREKGTEVVDFADITDKLLSKDFEFPKGTDIDLSGKVPLVQADLMFVPGELVQVTATGNSVWQGKFAGLSINVKKLNGFLQVKKANNQKEYKVRLSGELELNGFVSAKAILDITRKENRSLTAILQKKSTESADVGKYASELIGDTGDEWSKLVPTTSELAFATQAELFINFTKSLFVLRGQIKNIGSAVLVGKKTTEKRAFLFSLRVTDIKQIWPEMQQSVSDCFNISKIVVQIFTSQTTTSELQEDLKNAVEEKKSAASNEQEPSTPQLDENNEVKEPESETTASTTNESTNDESTEDKSTAPDDALDTPRLDGLPAEPLKPGAWFFAEISLNGSRPMSEALTRAADPDNMEKSLIILYAHVARPKSTYQINILNLHLLGGAAVVSGSGTYNPGSLQQIKVTAMLDLNELSRPLKFGVDYHVQGKTTTFSTKADMSSKPSISEPVPGMFNVELVNLGISGEISEGKKSYTVSGDVKFRNRETEKLFSGSILFESLKPCGILLTTDKSSPPWRVKDLSSKLIESGDTDKKVWPEGYPNFKLESLSIWFITGKTDFSHDGMTLRPGYNLKTSLSMFGKPFELEMGVSKGKMNFTATYPEDINLEFATLSKPSIEVDTGKEGGVFKVKGGLRFFESDQCDLQLSYQSKEKSFKGTVSLPDNFLGINKPTVDFTYKNGKFRFDNWAIENDMSQIADIDKLMKKGSENDGSCGKLVELVWQQAVKLKFKFKVGLPEDTEMKEQSDEAVLENHKNIVKDGKIALQVTWKYTISIVGNDNPVAEIPMEPITVNLYPEKMKGKNYGEILANLADHVFINLDKIAEQIFKNPETLGKVIGLLALKKLSAKMLERLFCRGAKTEQIMEAGEEKIENEAKDAEEELDKADEQIEQSQKAETASEASSALSKAKSILEGVGITLTGIGSLFASLFGGGGGGSSKKKELEEKLTKAKEKAKRIETSTEAAILEFHSSLNIISAQLVLNILQDDPQCTKVKFDWERAIPQRLLLDPATWKVQLSTTSDFTVIDKEVETTARSYEFTSNAWPYQPVFYVRIQGTVRTDDGIYEAADWVVISRSHKPYLHPPSNVEIVPEGDAGLITVSGPGEALSIEIFSETNKIGIFKQTYPSFPKQNQFSASVRLIAPPEYLESDQQHFLTITATNIPPNDNARARASTAATSTFDITDPIRDWKLEHTKDQSTLACSWNRRQKTSRGHPRVYFVSGDHFKTPPFFRFTDEPALNQVFLTQPEPFVSGDQVSVAVCEPDFDNDSISVFSQKSLTIMNLPNVTINDGLLNIGTKELTLNVSPSCEWPKENHSISAHVQYSDSTSADLATTRTGNALSLSGANVGCLQQAKIYIRVFNANQAETQGPEWILRIPSAMFAKPTITVEKTKKGVLAIHWDEIHGVKNMRVTVKAVEGSDSTKEVPEKLGRVTFVTGERKIEPGATFTIIAQGVTDNALGPTQVQVFTVPESSPTGPSLDSNNVHQ